jgi:hypothetical protein
VKTREQNYCRNCDKETLHTRERAEINHVLHALLSVLCCGVWLWVWLILALTRKTYPWICSVCGNQLGVYSEREYIEDSERKAEAKEQKRIRKGERRESKEQRRAEREADRNDPERMAAAKARAEKRKQAMSSAKDSIVAQITNALKQADAGLKLLAGDDDFFHMMLRVALVAVMLVMTAVVGYIAAGLVGLL